MMEYISSPVMLELIIRHVCVCVIKSQIKYLHGMKLLELEAHCL